MQLMFGLLRGMIPVAVNSLSVSSVTRPPWGARRMKETVNEGQKPDE